MVFSSVPHPFGVMPLGNAFLASQEELRVRPEGLGQCRCLTDELLLDLLSFLQAKELAQMIITSRAMYVYGNSYELWRDLALLLFSGESVVFQSTWKDTVAYGYCSKRGKTENYRQQIPLRVQGLFSNVLYQSWTSHSLDLRSACPGFFDFDDIPRVDSSTLSVADFVRDYELKNVPVVITNAVKDWNAFGKWTKEFLVEAYGDSKLRATSATATRSAEFTFKEYFKYAEDVAKEDEVPLYLFERSYALKAPQIEKDYCVPVYFSTSSFDHNYSNSQSTNTTTREHHHDLFRLLGEKARPDYRWLIAGPARSGSIFHVDPNQTNAWNVCIKGKKKWIFYPPHVSPPGVQSSADGADVAVPISIGEWLLTFWSFHLEARKHPNPADRPIETIVSAGDVVFVPHGYWHMVVNIDDCIALTHNYVSTSNLSDCLRFLREKPDQISGVRDRPGEAVQPQTLYDCFVKNLKTLLTDEDLDKYMKESFTSGSYEAEKSIVERTSALNMKSSMRKRKIGQTEFQSKPMGKNEITSCASESKSASFTFSFTLG